MYLRRLRRAAGTLLLGAPLLVCPPAAGAQSPEDRAALERLRDSLAALTDTVALSRLGRHTVRAIYDTVRMTPRA